jgi:site-specific recombinase XerD
MEALRPATLSESSLDVILPAFERSLLRENIAAATVRGYRWALDDLARFLRRQDVDDVAQLSRDLLERWQDQLRERPSALGGHLKASTRSIASTAARRLIRFAAERDMLDWKLERAVVRVRTVQNDPRPIDPEDLAKLQAHFSRPSRNIITLRDSALFFAFLTSGARVAEMLQLERSNYSRPVVVQKGGTEKVLRFPAEVVAKIADYIAARRDDLPWLWIALGNNVNAIRRLEAAGVREIWHRACGQLRIARFTTHQLRHTFGTELVDAEVPIEVVVETMGHHDLRTAMRYVKVSERRRQLAVDAAALLVPQSRPRLLPRLRRR